MGLLGRVAGRLRPKRKLNIPVIEVGSVLPAVEVEVVPPNATTEGAFLSYMFCTPSSSHTKHQTLRLGLAESVSLNIAEALGEGKSFLIGMPGEPIRRCRCLCLSVGPRPHSPA